MSKWYNLALKTLLVEILLLMALGAFVRTMNAGLACPDWPLCFGKVIPDFHPGVWYEFIHRADAGLVAITYFVLFGYSLFSQAVSLSVKRTAVAALLILLMLISAGAMTVLKQVAWLAVTTHLMLATTFFCLVLRILLLREPHRQRSLVKPPRILVAVVALCCAGIFLQIALGGVVASTYAGLVCVDWPLCNGVWVPTWSGAIGHQVIHRFIAYALAGTTLVLAIALRVEWRKQQQWLTPQILKWSGVALAVVLLQVTLGVLNLLFYIPPWITVPHQTVAIILLAVYLRFLQLLWGKTEAT